MRAFENTNLSHLGEQIDTWSKVHSAVNHTIIPDLYNIERVSLLSCGERVVEALCIETCVSDESTPDLCGWHYLLEYSVVQPIHRQSRVFTGISTLRYGTTSQSDEAFFHSVIDEASFPSVHDLGAHAHPLDVEAVFQDRRASPDTMTMTTGAPTHQTFFGLPRTLWRDLIRMGYITKHQTSGMLELRRPGHSQTIRVTTYVSNQSVKACRITKFMTHTTHPIPHHACNAFYRDVSYRGHRGQGHAFIMRGYLYLQLGSFTVVLLLDC